MPDIIGQILQRLEALEAAVNGRTSEYFDRKLFKAEVALREGVVARTIERNVAGSFPPPDGVTNGHGTTVRSPASRQQRARLRTPGRAPYAIMARSVRLRAGSDDASKNRKSRAGGSLPDGRWSRRQGRPRLRVTYGPYVTQNRKGAALETRRRANGKELSGSQRKYAQGSFS